LKTQRRGLASDERGQATFSLIVVLVVVVAAALLLQRTASTAESIDAKAENIAQTGRGINTATDAVLQLDVTNQRAGSILASAQPLEGQLSEVVRLAQSIDGLASTINGSAQSINGTAGSINGLAGSINGTAGRINGLAGGINGDAGSILDLARDIDNGVALINRNLDTTIALAQNIQADTSTIVGQAQRADVLAAEIDEAVNLSGLLGTGIMG
jgi:methyl-accepting chemotaxis protein